MRRAASAHACAHAMVENQENCLSANRYARRMVCPATARSHLPFSTERCPRTYEHRTSRGLQKGLCEAVSQLPSIGATTMQRADPMGIQ